MQPTNSPPTNYLPLYLYTFSSEYSKRIYQGVRVKHTVKDLLAEKRSRQTNPASSSAPPPAFVQMAGSHVIPSYYGVRRPYLSESELTHCYPSKQYTADVYSSSLGGKSFPCDGSVTGYPPLFDPYLTESFGDYRTSAFPPGTSSIFTSQGLPPLLPPFSNESSHYLLQRDSWESIPDSSSQGEGVCPDPPTHGSPSLPSPEISSLSQYRNGNRNNLPSNQGSTQPYPMPSLEDMHFASSYQGSAYTCPPFMTVPSELAVKMAHLSSDEPNETSMPLHDASPWAKEDPNTWSSYEVRRTY
uniref:Zgc:158412 n=1 Tax=Callorhinchus milii TaxID=7868 RepID=A0A4W3IAV1_CALMI